MGWRGKFKLTILLVTCRDLWLLVSMGFTFQYFNMYLGQLENNMISRGKPAGPPGSNRGLRINSNMDTNPM